MITASTLDSIAALIEPDNWVGSMANLSAQIMSEMPDLNWVGFYLWDGKQLRLGPFTGNPACTVIALGKGVCGTAAKTGQTQVVDDVDQFPGHIVCDAASKSEIVVPMFLGSQLIGVMDVDSPKLARFAATEKKFFESLVKTLCDQVFKTDADLPFKAPAYRASSSN
jgi:L-methionine (R)-S-oxide reductase